jgi:uncharacterized membrane protein
MYKSRPFVKQRSFAMQIYIERRKHFMIELDRYSNNLQSRFKSPVLLISMFTLIVFVLKEYFKIEIPKVNELLDLIMTVLIGFGIVNNPTDKDNI